MSARMHSSEATCALSHKESLCGVQACLAVAARRRLSEKASVTDLAEGGSRLEGVLLRCEGIGRLRGRNVGQGWRMVHSQERLQRNADTTQPLQNTDIPCDIHSDIAKRCDEEPGASQATVIICRRISCHPSRVSRIS